MAWKRSDIENRLYPLFDLLSQQEVSSVWLDIGAGDGLMGYLLQKRLPNSTILGTDIPRLSKSRNVAIRSYLQNCPIRKRSIGGILCSQVLHYIPTNDLKEIIKNLICFLVNNGILLIVEYEMRNSYTWIPYPITIQHLKDIVETIPAIQINSIKRIQDGNRPKYSVSIFKKI